MKAVALLLALALGVAAETLPASHYLYGEGGGFQSSEPHGKSRREPEPEPVPGGTSGCTNGPTTRSCWSNGYSVATDFDAKWPTTGVIRKYSLSITNTTCNPDGANPGRICLLMNNMYPGPTLTANWGDTISVTVTNNMKDNATGIHWHGIRQLNTNFMDGVSGITECPIAPGQSATYTFQATQFGTTWYHSHYSAQYGDGMVGALVINGPSSINYDIDLGPVIVNDFYYPTSYQIEAITTQDLQRASPGPPGDNILINGLNKNTINGGGSYSQFTLSPGKAHLLRLINTGVDNTLRVSIDNHPMTVITSDLVPVKPIIVDSVLLAVGQRYEVVVYANQTAGNYWMRATVENACFNANKGAGFAVMHYSNAPSATPTTSTTAVDNGCNPPSPLVPWVPNTVGSVAAFQSQAAQLGVNIDLPGVDTNNQNIVTWGINMSAISVKWGNPTLSYIMSKNTNYPSALNVISLPNEGIWAFWIIQEVEGGPVAIPHPMHLHGHDFYVLGSGVGSFNMTTDPYRLQYNNPTRRDTVFLPAGGWVVIAFQTDNPGAWLFHCHIAWHIAEGLGVQFLEATSQMTLPGADYTKQCKAFNAYQPTAYYQQDDSGL